MALETNSRSLPLGAVARPALAGPAVAAPAVSPRWVLCLVILGLAAVAMPLLERALGVRLRKEAVPLRKSLAAFDAQRLGPRYALHTYQHDRLSTDMVASLGTEEYVQLVLRDTTKEKTDPTYVAHVFVTYYTGKPDMVPHIPDECYAAAGFSPLGASNNQISLATGVLAADSLNVRSVGFEKLLGAGRRQKMAVLYFFHVNGDTASTRNGLRLRLSNLFQQYAYYSKIEVNYTSEYPFSETADEEQSLAAIGPLLEKLMPVLLQDHFDMAKFTRTDSGS